MLKELLIREIKFWDDGDVDGDGDDPVTEPVTEPSTKTYSEDEFNKAVARRQSALKAKRAAEDKLKALEDKVATMPDADEFEELQRKHREMMDAYKAMKEQQEEQELKKIEDEKDRERVKLQREFEKEKEAMLKDQRSLQEKLNSYEEDRKKYEQDMAEYRERALEGAIAASASTKAYNPQQIVRLTKDDFVYDDKEERWVREVYDKSGKLVDLLGIEEHINSFLDDPINENLLKVGVKSGSETPRSGREHRDDDTVPTDQTPTDEMYTWASESGFSINKKSSAEDKVWLYKTFTRLHGLDKKKE